MMPIVDTVREKVPYDSFSVTELATLLTGSKASRYGLIKRAVADGKLISLRRGLYCLAENYRRGSLNLFVIAQKMYGPSAISFESALSYHGWIPEAVYTVASATTRRSVRFENALGVFDFVRIPLKPFLTGVARRIVDKESFFMSRPWRAILDIVSIRKLEWTGIHPLIESLRIERESLDETDPAELAELEKAYHSRRISKFVKGVRKDLKL